MSPYALPVTSPASSTPAPVDPSPERMFVTTRPIADPVELLARLPHADPVAWVRDGEGLIGWGVAAIGALALLPLGLQASGGETRPAWPFVTGAVGLLLFWVGVLLPPEAGLIHTTLPATGMRVGSSSSVRIR